MPVWEYRAYVFHGYVENFCHASSSFWDVVEYALAVGGYVQSRRVGEKEWGPGTLAERLVA